jgi:hypothetical protein
MTIRQQGGVFGRNPKFNTLDTDGNTNLGDGVVQVDAASKEVGINTNPSVEFDVRGTGGFGELQVGGSNTAVKNVIYGDNNGGLILYADKDNTAASSSLRFYVDGTEAARFNSSRNLAFQDGNGIDFSATSGTGTSELFDDYEEGTWTPTLTTDGTDFSSVTYDALTGGKYIKTGKMVHVQLFLRTDAITVGSASGGVVIGGLPYANSTAVGAGGNARVPLSVGYAISWAGEVPLSSYILEGESQIRLYYRSSVDGNTLASAVADVDTGTNKNAIVIGGTYFAA